MFPFETSCAAGAPLRMKRLRLACGGRFQNTLLGNPSDLACLRMLGEETKERVQRDAQRLEKEDDIATTT
jgi:hypothetical protein